MTCSMQDAEYIEWLRVKTKNPGNFQDFLLSIGFVNLSPNFFFEFIH